MSRVRARARRARPVTAQSVRKRGGRVERPLAPARRGGPTWPSGRIVQRFVFISAQMCSVLLVFRGFFDIYGCPDESGACEGAQSTPSDRTERQEARGTRCGALRRPGVRNLVLATPLSPPGGAPRGSPGRDSPRKIAAEESTVLAPQTSDRSNSFSYGSGRVRR